MPKPDEPPAPFSCIECGVLLTHDDDAWECADCGAYPLCSDCYDSLHDDEDDYDLVSLH